MINEGHACPSTRPGQPSTTLPGPCDYALGAKPSGDVLRVLKSHGYDGSDSFTWLDALRFASQNDQSWGIVCQNVFGATPKECTYNPFTENTDTFAEDVAATWDVLLDLGQYATCVFSVAACVGIRAAREVAPKPVSSGRTMYHYTTEEGQRGIVESGELRPSLKSENPQDARYGDGQYMSDIAPGTKTCAQLSRCFIGQPFQGKRFTHYVEINVFWFECSVRTRRSVRDSWREVT
jgi:hypothetical protein